MLPTTRRRLLQEHHVKFEKYKMQDALILEEEEGQRLDKNKAAAKAVADREKKQRKKVPAVLLALQPGYNLVLPTYMGCVACISCMTDHAVDKSAQAMQCALTPQRAEQII